MGSAWSLLLSCSRAYEGRPCPTSSDECGILCLSCFLRVLWPAFGPCLRRASHNVSTGRARRYVDCTDSSSVKRKFVTLWGVAPRSPGGVLVRHLRRCTGGLVCEAMQGMGVRPADRRQMRRCSFAQICHERLRCSDKCACEGFVAAHTLQPFGPRASRPDYIRSSSRFHHGALEEDRHGLEA